VIYYKRRKNYIYIYSFDPKYIDTKSYLLLLLKADFVTLLIRKGDTITFDILKSRTAEKTIPEEYKDILLIEILNRFPR
jgi:hypothetical protein